MLMEDRIAIAAMEDAELDVLVLRLAMRIRRTAFRMIYVLGSIMLVVVRGMFCSGSS